jgi:hypothetical protein
MKRIRLTFIWHFWLGMTSGKRSWFCCSVEAPLLLCFIPFRQLYHYHISERKMYSQETSKVWLWNRTFGGEFVNGIMSKLPSYFQSVLQFYHNKILKQVQNHTEYLKREMWCMNSSWRKVHISRFYLMKWKLSHCNRELEFTNICPHIW